MHYTDYIQIFLLVVVVPALIMVLIYIRRKQIQQIDTNILSFLKNAIPQPIQEHEKSGIQKNYLIPCICGFFIIRILGEILMLCVERIVFSERIFISERVLTYSRITPVIAVSELVIGIIGPLLWSFWDKKRIQTKAELVKIPAYVHSTSNLSTSYNNPTAYLVYYDRTKERLRTKTVQIKRFESENGELFGGDFVLIVVEERNTRIRFVNIFKKTA